MRPSGLTVSVAPHMHCGNSIAGCMHNQIAALVPAVAVGVFFFGPRALLVIGVSIVTAVVMEMLMNRALKVECTLADGSAVLAGLLLALLMPASAPLWTVVVGAVICIVLAKWLFGGLGSYPFNPVLVAFVMLNISWPRIMTSWPAPNPITCGPGSSIPVETTLEVLKSYGVSMANQFSMIDALIGMQAGGIGTAAALALIAGGIYLVVRGFISWHIPAGYVAGIVIFAGIFRIIDPTMNACPGFHLLSGMTLIGIFFLAPEYATSPNTFWGKLLYGLGIGMLTMLIRKYGNYPDGTAFAILLMNLCTPIFDRIRPRVTGISKEVAADA
ncbi:RnfABCDGE type electron transport complex subunit D [bacterium]